MEQREIKFRAWDKVCDKMRFSFDILHTNKIEFSEGRGVYQFDIGDKVILMQFTGLKDKNGKEIYEGDIGEIDMDDPNNNKIWKVVYEGCCFQLAIVNGRGSLKYYCGTRSIKVIGNIYENPEKLKKEVNKNGKDKI